MCVEEELTHLINLARIDHAIDASGEGIVEDWKRDIDPEEAAFIVEAEFRGVVDQSIDEGVGATSYDGKAIPLHNGANGGGSLFAEITGSEIHVGILKCSEKMMWDPTTLFLGYLVGCDVEAGIHLYLVGVDNLRRWKVCGEVDCQLGFSGASGAHDDNHLVLAVVEEGVHGGGERRLKIAHH